MTHWQDDNTKRLVYTIVALEPGTLFMWMLDIIKDYLNIFSYSRRLSITPGTTLDKLPEINDKNIYDQKCQIVYQHEYDVYSGSGRSIYTITI
jgi:hypothetical protein